MTLAKKANMAFHHKSLDPTTLKNQHERAMRGTPYGFPSTFARNGGQFDIHQNADRSNVVLEECIDICTHLAGTQS